MAMPAAFCGDRWFSRLAQALQEVFEQAEGELGPGLTGGGGAEREAREMGEMATGGIAMEERHEKQLHGDHRIEETVTPRGIAHGFPGGGDRVGRQWGGPIWFEAPQDTGVTGDQGALLERIGVELPILPEEIRLFQSS